MLPSIRHLWLHFYHLMLQRVFNTISIQEFIQKRAGCPLRGFAWAEPSWKHSSWSFPCYNPAQCPVRKFLELLLQNEFCFFTVRKMLTQFLWQPSHTSQICCPARIWTPRYWLWWLSKSSCSLLTIFQSTATFWTDMGPAIPFIYNLRSGSWHVLGTPIFQKELIENTEPVESSSILIFIVPSTRGFTRNIYQPQSPPYRYIYICIYGRYFRRRSC